MPAINSARTFIRLDFNDREKQVLVHAEDEDRFLMTCEDAARACKQHMSVVDWRREFTRLLAYLRNWVEREGAVDACYVSLRDAQLVTFIVPKSHRFDFDLAPKLAELESEIAAEFPRTACDILQVPVASRDKLLGLMSTSNAVVVYGE